VIGIDFFNKAEERIEIKDISAGIHHSIFVPTNDPNTIYCCGRNVDGQLATDRAFKVLSVVKVQINNIAKIRCQSYSSIFITSKSACTV
jgi:alpha-tubulin suppressor-like RCC1 family protein